MNKRIFKIGIIALSILIFPLFAHALDDRTDTSGGPTGEKSDHAISGSRKNANYNFWKTISDLRAQQRRTNERVVVVKGFRSRQGGGRYQGTDPVFIHPIGVYRTVDIKKIPIPQPTLEICEETCLPQVHQCKDLLNCAHQIVDCLRECNEQISCEVLAEKFCKINLNYANCFEEFDPDYSKCPIGLNSSFASTISNNIQDCVSVAEEQCQAGVKDF